MEDEEWMNSDHLEIMQLRDEVRRLQKERDFWEKEAHDHLYDNLDEVERLRAENLRLLKRMGLFY